jgi:Uma2 family endonuclease
MSSAVTRAAEGLDRRLFTVDEILRMQEAGIISEDENFELVEGEIVPMQAKNHFHELVKSTLSLKLARCLPDHLWLQVATSLYMSKITCLSPDVLVHTKGLVLEKMKGTDVQLAIEVSEKLLAYDRGLKAQLYAKYGVQELWVIDVEAKRTFVHKKPVDGKWQSLVALEAQEDLRLPSIPDFSVRLSEI